MLKLVWFAWTNPWVIVLNKHTSSELHQKTHRKQCVFFSLDWSDKKEHHRNSLHFTSIVNIKLDPKFVQHRNAILFDYVPHWNEIESSSFIMAKNSIETHKIDKICHHRNRKKMLKINWLHLMFAEAIQMVKTIQNWQFTHDQTHQSICSLEATQFVVSHFNSLVSGYLSVIVYCRCKKNWSTLFFPNAKYYVFDRNNKTAFCFLFNLVFIFIEKVKIHMQINGTFEKSCIIRCAEKTDKMVRK